MFLEDEWLAIDGDDGGASCGVQVFPFLIGLGLDSDILDAMMVLEVEGHALPRVLAEGAAQTRVPSHRHMALDMTVQVPTIYGAEVAVPEDNEMTLIRFIQLIREQNASFSL